MRISLLMMLVVAIALAWVARPENADAYELGGIEYDARVLTSEGTQTADTQWYADHYGVTLDEATRRLALGPEISKLQSKLRLNEPKSFAGLWIEHTPEYRVVVQFTDNGNETIRPHIRSGSLGRMVEVRMADLSEATLIKSQQNAVRITDNLGIDKDSSVDIRNNRVEFNVLDKSDLFSQLDSRGVSLPAGVSVVQVASLSNPTADIFGGKTLVPQGNSPEDCTSGFSVTDGTDEGVTTAGHCENKMSYNGTNLNWKSESDQGPYDIQWHSTPSFTVRNLVYDGSNNRYILDEELRADQYVGQNVCMYGITSGGDCGEILSTTFDLVNVKTDIIVAGGDSGGPFFWNNTAFGTTISVIKDENDTPVGSVYGPVDQITGILGLDLILE